MESLMDFNLLQLIIMAVTVLIVWALPSIFPGIEQKRAWKIVDNRLEDVTDEVVTAVDKDSEGGKNITRSEWRSIIARALKKEQDE
jgi:hypothetical protein